MQGTIGCWCRRHDKSTTLSSVFIMVKNGEPRLFGYNGDPVATDELFGGMTPHFLVTVPTINTPAELAELVKVCVPPDREVRPYERSVAYEYRQEDVRGMDTETLTTGGWEFCGATDGYALFRREVLVRSQEGASK